MCFSGTNPIEIHLRLKVQGCPGPRTTLVFCRRDSIQKRFSSGTASTQLTFLNVSDNIANVHFLVQVQI